MGLESWLRLLLRTHPRPFRRRYGDEIVETARARVEAARRDSGRLAGLRRALVECAGLAAAGLKRRFAVARASRPPSSRSKLGFPLLEKLGYELRFAARGLLRQPGLTLLAVVALGLGIGATVAVFTVFHAVLLSPLPFREPDRLVAIWETNPERGWDRAQVAAANYLDWRASATRFADVAAYNDWLDERVLVARGESSLVLASEVTGNFFDVLGVVPLEGRTFDDAHTWAGPEPVVVISEGFRERHFGSGGTAVGRSLELDGVSHRVLGVMPASFRFPFADAELWAPVSFRPERRDEVSFRRAHGMRVIGRLAPGASLAEAEAELAAIAARLEADYPETNTGMGTGAATLREWIVGDATRPLQILMAAVGFVLFIACANVSNMLLARWGRRREELRVRSALGGGRARLVLQSLVESLLLAGLGGALGLALGLVAIEPLLALSPAGLPRMSEVSPGAPVALFALGVTLASGLLFGGLPAWRAASLALSAGARGASQTRGSRRTASLLVAVEVALTLPLVVGAGLMVRTLVELYQVEPGFDPENVVVASVFLPSSSYETAAEMAAFHRELFEASRTLPGVEAAAMSSRLPLAHQRWTSDFTAEGWSPDRFGMNVRHDEITPGLFRALGVPLLRGRDFDLGDDRGAPNVVVVNEALAERYFPGEDPIGRRVAFDRVAGESSVWRTIVGVVGNVRREALRLEEAPCFYAPVLQDPTRRMHVLLRTEREASVAVAALRETLRGLDPALPLFDVTSLEDVVEASVARERFLLALLALAAAVALLLASVGIFGVVLHATTARAREIGIRLALGARAPSVVGLVLRSGLVPVAAGMGVGLLAAVALSRALSSYLFEVRPLDPLTFGAVVALMLLAALAACAVPARWATRVDANAVLRTE